MYVDYNKATPEQQTSFRRVNSQLAPHFGNYKLWVTRSGLASLRKGHWDWTDKYAKAIDAQSKAVMRGDHVRTRGDLRGFKTATFHLDRYSK